MKAESILGFRHPVYLVTVRQKIIHEREAKREASASNPSDASIVAKASHRKAVESTFGFKSRGEIVCAYQLMKIECILSYQCVFVAWYGVVEL